MEDEAAPTPDKAEVSNFNMTIICPECGELVEVSDVRAVMLANHLARFCDETQVWLHD